MLSTIFSWGQTQTTAPSKSQSLYGFVGETLPAVDTISIYILAGNADRHRKTGFMQLGADDTLRPVYSTRWLPEVWQIEGFAERVKESDRWNESYWMQPVRYFDADFHPLPKTYIIWQTQPRP